MEACNGIAKEWKVGMSLVETRPPPNAETVSALKLHSKMKRDARDTDNTNKNIITTNIGEMHEEVLVKLSRIDTIRK